MLLFVLRVNSLVLIPELTLKAEGREGVGGSTASLGDILIRFRAALLLMLSN